MKLLRIIFILTFLFALVSCAPTNTNNINSEEENQSEESVEVVDDNEGNVEEESDADAESESESEPEPTNTTEPTEEPTDTPELTAEYPPIVFSSNRSDDPNKIGLYLIDPETLEITAIDTGEGNAVLPSWSADGTRIAFAKTDIWNLFTINPDGSELTQITDFRSNNPDWSADGLSLVFQSDHQNEPQDTPDIYTIGINGENLLELIDDPEVIDYSPRWSPDGSSILFISAQTGSLQLFTMNPDGSELTQITDGQEPVQYADWSPDGERIVFVYGPGQATDLYIINKDGATDSVVRVTADADNDTNPCFSPDGDQLVFASNRSGSWDLWLINIDGSNLTQLTNDEYYDNFPNWSLAK